MAMFPPPSPPKVFTAETWSTVPSTFRQFAPSDHHRLGKVVDSFLEGPIIVNGLLYVTDIPYGRIFSIDPSSPENWTLVIQYDGEPNGLAWHPTRRQILIADRKNGILGLDLETKKLDPILKRFQGESFKGPNDLIVSGDGSILFTDQGMSGLQDPSGRVYRLSADGKITILLQHVPSPNGLVFDKAEDNLFVAVTRDNAVWHAPLPPDGSTQRTGRFSNYYGIGGPDGLTLDVEGNLFVAHVSLGCIFVHRPNGEPLAKIVSSKGAQTTNMTWGGKEGKTLYITESQTGHVLLVEWHCRGWLGPIYHGAEGVEGTG